MTLESTSVRDADPPVATARPARWRGLVRSGLARLVDIVTPPVCLACHEPQATHDTLCAACWSRIDFIRAPLCDRLGIPLPYDAGAGTLSAAAVADPPAYARARYVARYDGVMRELIHDIKFRDRHDPTHLLARWMVEAGRALIDETDVLVPIPLHRWKLIRRRFNQSALLGSAVARLTGKPHAPLALVRTRSTRSQVGLTLLQREENMKGAFAVPARWCSEIAGRRVLLIEDVVTTGATVAAATLALRKAGAADVDVLALARVTDTAATLDA